MFRANRTKSMGLKGSYCSKRCFQLGRKRAYPEGKGPGSKGYRKALQDKRIASGLCRYCESKPAPGKKSCSPCLEKRRILTEAYKEGHKAKGLCLSCKTPAEGRLYCTRHRAEKNRTTIRNNLKVKREVFERYGGCVCNCCSEGHIEFLTIDHIDGNGAEHRRRIFGKSAGMGGARLYRALKREGFPAGFQVLCFNCNVAKGFYGECPHKRVPKGVP